MPIITQIEAKGCSLYETELETGQDKDMNVMTEEEAQPKK